MADQAAAAGLGLPPEDGGGPASQQGMRRQNLGRVMHAIAARGPVSRAELADSTGLTRAAVGSLVGELQAAGLVTDQGLARSGRGRPGSRWTLTRPARRAWAWRSESGTWPGA